METVYRKPFQDLPASEWRHMHTSFCSDKKKQDSDGLQAKIFTSLKSERWRVQTDCRRPRGLQVKNLGLRPSPTDPSLLLDNSTEALFGRALAPLKLAPIATLLKEQLLYQSRCLLQIVWNASESNPKKAGGLHTWERLHVVAAHWDGRRASARAGFLGSGS